MIALIVTIFAALAISAEARDQRIKIFEILDATSSEREPVLKRIDKIPPSKVDAAVIARHLVNQIQLSMVEDESTHSSSSSEEKFVDNTRSSLLVVPADGDTVFQIVSDLNENSAGTKNNVGNIQAIPVFLEPRESVPHQINYGDKGWREKRLATVPPILFRRFGTKPHQKKRPKVPSWMG